MKKILTYMRRLSRFQLFLGLFALLALCGGVTWGVYDNRQRSNAKERAELTQATQLDDQRLSEQKLKAGLEVATNSGQQVPPSGSDTTSPQALTPSAYRAPSSDPVTFSGNQASPLQYTQPAQSSVGGSPTSPAYPTDTGDTPQITLTNPGYWKQIVSGSFTATATASDSSGINRVVFMLRKIGQTSAVQTVTDSSAPYSAVVDVSGLPNGDSDYAIEAQVFDNAGKGNLASYRINIQN